MTYRTEMKIYRLVDRIMRYGEGKVRYEDAYESAKSFYSKKHPFLGWGTHVGDDFLALELSQRLAK